VIGELLSLTVESTYDVVVMGVAFSGVADSPPLDVPGKTLYPKLQGAWPRSWSSMRCSRP